MVLILYEEDKAKLIDLNIYLFYHPLSHTVFGGSTILGKLNALSYFNTNNRQLLNRNCACLPFLDLLCLKGDG